MPKNHELITRQKQLKRYLDTVIPQAYSAFCIVLNRHEVDDDTIAQIFAETQDLWTESANNGTNIVKYAYDLTGILTVSIKQAKENGIELPEEVNKRIEKGMI